jgi:hypothetical protein
MGDGTIDPQKLTALMGLSIEAEEAAREIKDAVAGDIRAASLTHGLHLRAFTMCRQIARMDQVKRLALLQAFDNYREILNLDNAPQAELLPDPPTQLRAQDHGKNAA